MKGGMIKRLLDQHESASGAMILAYTVFHGYCPDILIGLFCSRSEALNYVQRDHLIDYMTDKQLIELYEAIAATLMESH